ncbi:MAG TPA: ketoacyl-ACP synthase III [Chitinophagaceae bacterium]|nr:ketoacyl-ACP synthase III [Chitinophagaceae bacterium]
MLSAIITGTGACIPEKIQLNQDFTQHNFFDEKGLPLADTAEAIIEKFRKITGINERRYAPTHLNTSDIAAVAGKQALINSGIDPETLDQIVVSHNFGDVAYGSIQSQNVPTLASRVKHLLGVVRPECIAYDVLVGCPGWVHSLIQSHAWFKAGMAKKVLLIGAETLSRVIDISDRDSMIFSDGAGACVLEYKESVQGGPGILGTSAQTHSAGEFDYIDMGKSYKSSNNDPALYIKMKGRKVYEYALKYVPRAMKACLDQAEVDIRQVSKILIHQANEKMDEEIVKRLYSLYGLSDAPSGIMPMSIQWLGNSSVATIPTLYHLIRQGEMPEHKIKEGDIILFASVGAGMNINAVCYRV